MNRRSPKGKIRCAAERVAASYRRWKDGPGCGRIPTNEYFLFMQSVDKLVVYRLQER